MLKKLFTRKNLLRAAAAFSLLEGILCAILRGKEKMAVPTVLLVVWLAVSVLAAILLDPRDRKEFEANHHADTLNLLALLGGLLIFIGAVITVFSAVKAQNIAGVILGLFLVAAAVCVAVNGLAVVKKSLPGTLLPAIQTLAVAGALVLSYRGWSIEPKIGCYIFPLFALSCVLIASYYFMVFALNRGSRAGMTFCCCFGSVAAFGAAFGAGFGNALVYLGFFCFLLSELSSLLYNAKKRKGKKNEQDDTAEDGFDGTAEEQNGAEATDETVIFEAPVTEDETEEEFEEEPEEETLPEPEEIPAEIPETAPVDPAEKAKYSGMSMFDILAEFDEPEEAER